MSFDYSFAATLMSRFSFPVAGFGTGASGILHQVVLHQSRALHVTFPASIFSWPLLDWFQCVSAFHALKMPRWDMYV